jgi:hypothetical protein
MSPTSVASPIAMRDARALRMQRAAGGVDPCPLALDRRWFACFLARRARYHSDVYDPAQRSEKSPLLDAMLRQSVKPMSRRSPLRVTPLGSGALVPGPSTARLHLSPACPQRCPVPQKICAQAAMRTAGERVNALLQSRAAKGQKSCSLLKHRPGVLWITPCRPATIAASFRRLGRSSFLQYRDRRWDAGSREGGLVSRACA